MSIVVEGLGELIVLDVFPLNLADEERGVCTVHIHLPADADWDLRADEGETAWPEIVKVSADSEDECLGIEVAVAPPHDWPLTVYARWGEDEEVVRGPASTPVQITLDGLPKRSWAGFFDGYGGPERVPGVVGRDNG